MQLCFVSVKVLLPKAHNDFDSGGNIRNYLKKNLGRLEDICDVNMHAYFKY